MPKLDRTFLAILGACAATGAIEGLAEAAEDRRRDVERKAHQDATLPNGWNADDAAYELAQSVRAGHKEKAGEMLRNILSSISPEQYRRMWSMMPALGSQASIWKTAISVFDEIESDNYTGDEALLNLLRVLAKAK